MDRRNSPPQFLKRCHLFCVFILNIVLQKTFLIENKLLKLQTPYKTTIFGNYKADIYWNKKSQKHVTMLKFVSVYRLIWLYDRKIIF